jgi:hypothetical protein
VRISLTLNTFDSSGCFEQDTWSVFHRMLFSSRKVSGARTTQSPRDFSLKCHPMMSPPVSDDGRCLVGSDAGVSGVLGLRSWSSARKVRNSFKASKSCVLESSFVAVSAAATSFSVSASSWSKRLAPGSTSGAGNCMMLSEMRMELVSCTRHRYER